MKNDQAKYKKMTENLLDNKNDEDNFLNDTNLGLEF